ncbi:MAG: Mu transposase C-terminal domain-containing protein [Peptostreptococcaceae bacterium]|nr:Mu transposase C-terminal domain-containing protein [Peptostreptococcaceae bacterium]
MLLTVREVAELKGCTERYIRMWINQGKIAAVESENPSNGKKEYRIEVSALPETLQKKYYARQKNALPQLPRKIEEEAVLQKKPSGKRRKKEVCERPWEEYSQQQREEIELWCQILSRWQRERNLYHDKCKADADILGAINLDLKKRGIPLIVNTAMLYRKYQWYKSGQLGGLLDDRGGWNKGKSSIADPVWDAFLFYYLDDRRPPLSKVYETTMEWTQTFFPELMASMPHERSFRRRLQAEVPQAVQTMLRKGEKALDDECLFYIERMYEDLQANDCWITDNHTLDIQSQADEKSGTKEGIHRLYLTAFMDAKSGIITGFNITDTPSINSTLFALRQGIEAFGKPKTILADNGSEFMSYDFNNRGRRKTKEENLFAPAQTILGRLGIELKIAKVKNAKAKPVERFFLDFKNHISRLLPTYTGGNILERPESLKKQIRNGNIPTDSKLRELLSDLIVLENERPYGGAEKKRYSGYTKMDVWNESIQKTTQILIPSEDLMLYLMRAKNLQKVKRNGVSLEIAGEKLWYNDHDSWLHIGKKVLLRYDPTDLSSVRLYDEEDRYLFTWQLETKLMLDFLESDPEKLAEANEKLAHQKKAVKEYAKGMLAQMPSHRKIDMLDLMIQKAHLAREGQVIERGQTVQIQRIEERPTQELPRTGTEGASIIDFDIARLNRNAAKRKGKSL